MIKRLLSICLILIFCGCIRTVQKYDPYDPETRTLLSRSLGVLPSKSREMKAFQKVREADEDENEIVNAFLSCKFTSKGSTRFGRLVNDLNDKNRCVDSYSEIINNPAYLERFLELLRENVTIKAPALDKNVNIHSSVPKQLLPLNQNDSGPKGAQDKKPVLRFVHLSDAQLRDENAKLVSHSMSRFLDSFVGSVERNTSQEYFDLEYYMAIILSINAFAPEEKPDFMIHTGDAIDVRTSQELYPFIYINNLLDIPWFNVVGNHDSATLGNFNNKRCSFKNVGYSFLSPGNLFHFMLMHGPTYIHDDSPLTPTKVHEDVTVKTGSYFHGFDLYKGSSASYSLPKGSQGATSMKGAYERVCNSPGYYSLEFKEKGVRLIVLNTSIPLIDEKRNKIIEEASRKKTTATDEEYINSVSHSTAANYCYKGKVDKRQLDWLVEELENGENQGQLILVFGHHPLNDENFLDDTYERLVENFCRHKNVVAYFCGHTHEQKVRYIKDPGNPKMGVWEIDSGSLLDYPQEGNLITLYDLGNGCGRLDVQSFGIFDVDSQAPSGKVPLMFLAYKAHRGAEEDWIKDHYGSNIHRETSEELEKLPGGIQLPDSLPDPLKEKLRYDNDRQRLAFIGVMKEEERNTLLKLSQEPLYQEAIKRLFLNSREGKPHKNNYALYFPISGWKTKYSQNTPLVSQKENKEEKESRVKGIIKPHIKQPDSLEVHAELINGELVLWRFKIKKIHDDDQKLFEENPFLYRSLAYLVEKTGEEEKEAWQLVREWQNNPRVSTGN